MLYTKIPPSCRQSPLVKGTWRWVNKITVRTDTTVKSHSRPFNEIHHLWESGILTAHLKQCELWLCITVKKRPTEIRCQSLKKVINQPSLYIYFTTHSYEMQAKGVARIRFTVMLKKRFDAIGNNMCQAYVVFEHVVQFKYWYFVYSSTPFQYLKKKVFFV